MQIVTLSLDFYRVTAYVYAVIETAGKQDVIYDSEMSFRVQQDISISPCSPLEPFCRSWTKGQGIGIPDGASDIEESLKQAISSTIKRVYKPRFKDFESCISVVVEVTEVKEQEAFPMTGLHKDFCNGTIRFYFKRK